MLHRSLLAALKRIGLWTPQPDLEEGLTAYRRHDYEAACRTLLPLAKTGDPDAQYHLGRLYQQGDGVPQDEAEAIRWYRRAAEREQAEAQLELGRTYDEGVVVPQDDAEAARWYEQAARHGHPRAQYLLALMYLAGRGVPADPLEAYAWLSIAENNPAAMPPQASEKRAEIARTLTPTQAQEAQRHLAEIAAGLR